MTAPRPMSTPRLERGWRFRTSIAYGPSVSYWYTCAQLTDDEQDALVRSIVVGASPLDYVINVHESINGRMIARSKRTVTVAVTITRTLVQEPT